METKSFEQKTQEAYKIAFRSPNGQLVLDDLVKEYVLNTGFPKDPNRLGYDKGARDVILRILALVYRNGDDAYDTLLSIIKRKEK